MIKKEKIENVNIKNIIKEYKIYENDINNNKKSKVVQKNIINNNLYNLQNNKLSNLILKSNKNDKIMNLVSKLYNKGLISDYIEIESYIAEDYPTLKKCIVVKKFIFSQKNSDINLNLDTSLAWN